MEATNIVDILSLPPWQTTWIPRDLRVLNRKLAEFTWIPRFSPGGFPILTSLGRLRLLDTYASKIAKICTFWMFRLVIQLIKQLFKIWQSASSSQEQDGVKLRNALIGNGTIVSEWKCHADWEVTFGAKHLSWMSHVIWNKLFSEPHRQASCTSLWKLSFIFLFLALNQSNDSRINISMATETNSQWPSQNIKVQTKYNSGFSTESSLRMLYSLQSVSKETHI